MHLNRSLDLGFVGNNVLVDEDIRVSPSFESGILFKIEMPRLKFILMQYLIDQILGSALIFDMGLIMN